MNNKDSFFIIDSLIHLLLLKVDHEIVIKEADKVIKPFTTKYILSESLQATH